MASSQGTGFAPLYSESATPSAFLTGRAAPYRLPEHPSVWHAGFPWTSRRDSQVIVPFEFEGDNRWQYEVDEEAEHPWLQVRHPVYGDDGRQLGRAPAGDLAKLIASEIKAKYDQNG